MNIIDDFLTINPVTRSGYKREETLAVVLHWVGGVAKKSAKGIRDWIESLKDGKQYLSIQYSVGWKGEIIRCMPDEERAYHVGCAGVPDPVSGKFYTDYARETFGKYATDNNYSPSYCTIGIEMCHMEDDGRFSKETLNSTMELCVSLFKKYPNLNPYKNLCTHQQIVGWKNCPLWFTSHPEDFKDFQHGLALNLKG
jgi:N-acetylmuramoyl-L-alanine amidase